MATRNPITGDSIISKKPSKEFDEGFAKIKPSCYNTCTYQVDTLTKCRVCDWHPKRRDNVSS